MEIVHIAYLKVVLLKTHKEMGQVLLIFALANAKALAVGMTNNMSSAYKTHSKF